MCFQYRESMNWGIFRSISNIKWTNSQFDFLSYMWRQERKEKRKPPTSEKCYIPSMGLSIIESEIDSPCFSELFNLKSIHLASEFCQKYRIEVRYQKDFGYLEKMVGINLDLFQSTAIHSDPSLLFPLVLWVPRFKWLVSFFCFTTLFVYCLSILLPLAPILKPNNIISNQSFQPMRLVDFNSNTITYVKTLHSLFPVQLELSHVQSQLLLTYWPEISYFWWDSKIHNFCKILNWKD